MDFVANWLPKILEGLVIGGLFSHTFIRISTLIEDVKDLKKDRWNKVSREELMSIINHLTQRILVIETKMQERENNKSQS